ncbi:MAG: integrase family protein [Pseudolabrys sp.]
MPTAKLTTKGAVDKLPHPAKGQALWWDTSLRGFGVLVGVRNKTFVIQRDVKGRSRRITIGRYGEGGISLHAARKQAEQLAGQMRGGTDPVEEEREATADNMTLREAWALYEAHLAAEERSPRTGDGYWKSIERYCDDWLDRPLVEITPEAAHKRHTHIGSKHGKYAANGTMRALRAIWRRAQRQHHRLGLTPTVNVDFYKEKPREAVVEDLAAWWCGVQKIGNPVRRDLFIFLLFTGCRSGEAKTLRWEQVDLEAGGVHFPVTKTNSFDLPLSRFLVDLLKARRACEGTRAVFGKDCPWVFPAQSEPGHVVEVKLSASEMKLFAAPWTPHTLRHTWISISENKVSLPAAHSRLLANHAVPKSGDAHKGYNHPDFKDLRKSQQKMTKFLKLATQPRPKRPKLPKPTGNVVSFAKQAKR